MQIEMCIMLWIIIIIIFFDRQIKLKLQKWYNSQIEAMIKQSIDFKFLSGN